MSRNRSRNIPQLFYFFEREAQILCLIAQYAHNLTEIFCQLI